MNRLRGFSLVGAVAAFGTAAVVGRPFGQEIEAEPVRGPEDLREELRSAQFAAPPCEGVLACDAGAFPFLPDGSDPDGERFAAGLLSGDDGNGTWPAEVFEDRETRETVFLNSAGAEILRLPPPPGYAAGWILDALYPEGGVPADVAAGYDPARVVLAARLRFPDAAMKKGEVGEPCLGDRRGPGAARTAGCAVSSPHGGNAGAVSEEGPGRPGVVQDERRADRRADGRGLQTWYVDSDAGRDSDDGLCPAALGGGRGPLASVQKAIDAAKTGDVIEVCGQAALPDTVLRPGDKRVRLRPRGRIRF